MNDMKCPYCGAEWEHDYADLGYTEEKGEYECPSCERIFIMSGELEPVFYEETAEDYYERKIAFAKDFVEYYNDKIIRCMDRGDEKAANHCKKNARYILYPRFKRIRRSTGTMC